MATVLVEELAARFGELFARASAGEEVVIAGTGDQQMRLVPVTPRPTVMRQPGALKGLVSVPDSFWEPLPPGFDGWPEDGRD